MLITGLIKLSVLAASGLGILVGLGWAAEYEKRAAGWLLISLSVVALIGVFAVGSGRSGGAPAKGWDHSGGYDDY